MLMALDYHHIYYTQGKNLQSRWMQGGPASCMYSVSDSGWMESANFLQWLEKMFVTAFKHLT